MCLLILPVLIALLDLQMAFSFDVIRVLKQITLNSGHLLAKSTVLLLLYCNEGVARGLITKMMAGRVLTMNSVYCRARECRAGRFYTLHVSSRTAGPS